MFKKRSASQLASAAAAAARKAQTQTETETSAEREEKDSDGDIDENERSNGTTSIIDNNTNTKNNQDNNNPDSSDGSVVFGRKRKRGELGTDSSVSASASSGSSVSVSSVSVSVSSARSVLPDQLTVDHRHVLDWDSGDKEKKADKNRGISVPRPMSGTGVIGRAPSRFGPVRPNSSVRAISRFDYQPDICKDWKETGFCGYGDSCKFLHDRTDYKSGWELERDWRSDMDTKRKAREEKELRRKRGETIESDDDNDNKDSGSVNYEITSLRRGRADDERSRAGADEDLPFACHICRAPFTSALSTVVTGCGHYFHEKCALKRYSTNSKCAVCNAETNGTFKQAHDLEKKISQRDSRSSSHMTTSATTIDDTSLG